MHSFSCPPPCGFTDILNMRTAENLKSLFRIIKERQKGLWYHDAVEQGSEIIATCDNENIGEQSSGADLVVRSEIIHNELLEKVSTGPVIPPTDEQKEDVQKRDKLHVPTMVTVNKQTQDFQKRDKLHVPSTVTVNSPASRWPVWLSAVAGDVTKGWDPLQGKNFEKLEKIGYGPRSIVYKARNLLTGKFVAIKKVRFDTSDPVSVKFMAKEIRILRGLDHPNVMKLEGLITSKTSRTLYLVFEYMEHDLASLSARIWFSEGQVKSYMNQLLSGLDYCHRRGVLHCNINGSHLLIHNNSWMLKIAGFGSASILSFDRKSRIIPSGNLVYKAPEIFYGKNYGIGVDLWSAGCVLAAFMGGKPIMAAQTEMDMIFKLCGITTEEDWRRRLPIYKNHVKETFKEFPPSSVALLETLLAIDPAERKTAIAALMSEFFTTGPCCCQDSSFQKYPPKEELVNLKKKKVRLQVSVHLESSRASSEFLPPSPTTPTAGIPVKCARGGVQYIDGS
ncbi:probable serine/threonine-protein kinase At1g54610 isoform X2 [Papaver somniferum]|uniref:probable serine/threonine-protein kinase At1g54610 isoform X2 n=1 Tax=Papaver somniferum TaxID=3469 RepID=UPI000E6F9EEC|nr:probable serine/threonine-protein kinase At1g54610 isoform X2 [Papaver somniferum]